MRNQCCLKGVWGLTLADMAFLTGGTSRAHVAEVVTHGQCRVRCPRAWLGFGLQGGSSHVHGVPVLGCDQQMRNRFCLKIKRVCYRWIQSLHVNSIIHARNQGHRHNLMQGATAASSKSNIQSLIVSGKMAAKMGSVLMLSSRCVRCVCFSNNVLATAAWLAAAKKRRKAAAEYQCGK